MQLDVIDWNINGMRPLRDQARLLAELDWDVLALQEVTQDAFSEIQTAFPAAQAASAAEYTSGVSKLTGKDVPFYAALFVREPLELFSARSLPQLPSPERAVVGVVQGGGRTFDAASFAIPPGVTWGDKKVEQVRIIAEDLAQRERPVVFGMDRNTPKWDRIDPDAIEWWWDEEAKLFGATAPHDLRDVFRDHLERDPDEVERIRRLRPGGPLALTFLRGRKLNFATPCRYDVIYASPEFEIIEVTNVFDDAVAAGSDHGLVHASLRLSDTSS